ncbi:outer membrane lipoprotein-sorting protein [Fodinibius saliphilus]|uniref:outer membrane lipoprotein-sorting protein n=1 Tax=Fodinibius saliphilus TaxID=1920650 RepID=UPI00110A0833|nr:outer membrane lipoprotein-sorting protein [Fodinibius saliphilus]
MQAIKKYCLATILFLFSCTFIIQAQNATDIVKKADKKIRGESSRAKITMKIIRPTWQREVSMKAWSLGTEYSLILVTAPARDQGTAYLKRDNEIWNWLPNINRTIKMPPSMMSQSWMGSDFSNNDLVEESSIVTDYNHTIAGDSTLSDYECYRIIMSPKPQAPVVWGKLISFISKQEYLQLRTEFYNEDGKLIKVMEGSQIENMNGRTIPTKMEMIPMDKKNQKTVLLYEDIAFNIDIAERFFSIQNLKNLD